MLPNTTLTDCQRDFGAFTDQIPLITESQEFAFTRQCAVSPFIAEKIPQLRPAVRQVVKPLELL
jgi:hypothetical protein